MRAHKMCDTTNFRFTKKYAPTYITSAKVIHTSISCLVSNGLPSVECKRSNSFYTLPFSLMRSNYTDRLVRSWNNFNYLYPNFSQIFTTHMPTLHSHSMGVVLGHSHFDSILSLHRAQQSL